MWVTNELSYMPVEDFLAAETRLEINVFLQDSFNLEGVSKIST